MRCVLKTDQVKKVMKDLSVIGRGVLLETDKDRVRMSATNSVQWLECVVDAVVMNEGKSIVLGRALAALTSNITEPIFELFHEGNYVQVSFTKGTECKGLYKIQVMTDFPPLPAFDNTLVTTFLSDELLEGLQCVVFAAEKGFGIFNSVHFCLKDGMAELVASDRFRLSLTRISGEGTGIFTVPLSTIRLLISLLSKSKEKILVQQTNNLVAFGCDNWRLSTSLISEKYVDYQKIIPTEFKEEVKLKVTDILPILRRMSGLRTKHDLTLCVDLSLPAQKDYLDIVALFSDYDGEKVVLGRERIKVERQGQDSLNISFQLKYLLEFFTLVKSGDVKLCLQDSTKAALLRPISGNDWLYLVMPMQIKG